MIIVNLILKSFPQKMYFIHDPNQDDAMCEPQNWQAGFALGIKNDFSLYLWVLGTACV